MNRVPPRVQNKARWAIAILIVLVLTIVGWAYLDWSRLRAANVAATRTDQILDATAQLLSGLLDAETGQRGYLLTGADRYLDPYNRAVKSVPQQLSVLTSLTAGNPRESADFERLNRLIQQKMAELQQTIELRRTQGAQAALDVVLSDRGRAVMDQIRAALVAIEDGELGAQRAVSADAEAVSVTVLLTTVAAALMLLFFFLAGIDPVLLRDPHEVRYPQLKAYGIAVMAATLAILLRLPLTSMLAHGDAAFLTFFPAVLFASWYAGARSGAATVLLLGLASAYYVFGPSPLSQEERHAAAIALLFFVLVGSGVVYLAHSQRQALARADLETAQRRIAEESERAQRRYFETTLASIGDAVVSTDAQGRVQFVNDVARGILRYPDSQLIGRPLEQVFRIVNERTRQPVESPVAKVLREGQVVGMANHTILIAGDGAEIPLDDSGAPLRGDDGSITGVVLVFRDVTERRAAERQLAIVNADLSRSNADLEQFGRIASHDLQEPLRMITSYAQLLARKYPGATDADAAQFIQNIVDGTTRMRTLLTDLLQYAEIGSLHEQKGQTADLRTVVEHVRQNLKDVMEASGATIECSDLPVLQAGETYLLPLFQNLASNAIKYRGEEPPRIRVSAHQIDGEVCFAFSDNGVGIDPQYHKKIFDVFQRLHGREVPGTGLGLAICKRVVERYRGRIWVESKPGAGSTFFFTLPEAVVDGKSQAAS